MRVDLTNNDICQICFQRSSQDPIASISSAAWLTRGRGFQQIGSVSSAGELRLDDGEIFPNAKFGFNGRKFMFSTKEVCITWLMFECRLLCLQSILFPITPFVRCGAQDVLWNVHTAALCCFVVVVL